MGHAGPHNGERSVARSNKSPFCWLFPERDDSKKNLAGSRRRALGKSNLKSGCSGHCHQGFEESSARRPRADVGAVQTNSSNAANATSPISPASFSAFPKILTPVAGCRTLSDHIHALSPVSLSPQLFCSFERTAFLIRALEAAVQRFENRGGGCNS